MIKQTSRPPLYPTTSDTTMLRPPRAGPVTESKAPRRRRSQDRERGKSASQLNQRFTRLYIYTQTKTTYTQVMFVARRVPHKRPKRRTKTPRKTANSVCDNQPKHTMHKQIQMYPSNKKLCYLNQPMAKITLK